MERQTAGDKMRVELLFWWYWAEQQGMVDRVRKSGRRKARGLRANDFNPLVDKYGRPLQS